MSTSSRESRPKDAPPFGVELAFCPTGPGGGIDNSCGKGEGGGTQSKESIVKQATAVDDELKKLYKERESLQEKLKEARKDGGKPSSALKKERAALYKKIEEAEAKLGGIAKAPKPTPKESPKPSPEPKAKEKEPEPKKDAPQPGTLKEHGTTLMSGKSQSQSTAKYGVIRDQLKRLREKYPLIDKHVSKMVDGVKLRVELIGGQPTKGALGKYYVGASKIQIKEKLDNYQEKAPKMGTWTVGQDTASVFRHEFGHKIWYEAFGNKERNEFSNAAFSIGKAAWSSVSQYGATSMHELFAESFSAFTHPGYKSGMLPEPLEKFMKQTMKTEASGKPASYAPKGYGPQYAYSHEPYKIRRINLGANLGWECNGRKFFGRSAQTKAVCESLRSRTIELGQSVETEVESFGSKPWRQTWESIGFDGKGGHVFRSDIGQRLILADEKFGCLMMMMPPEVEGLIHKLQARIKPEDLVEMEVEPHVTVRYGFGPDVSPDDFLPIVSDASPIKLTLLEPDLFLNDNDVLKLNIFSACLGKLNAACSHLDLSGETYKDYKPHLTLAYLKKGTGWKYAGDPRLSELYGRDVVLDTVVYSDRNKKRTTLFLQGDKTKSLAGVDITDPTKYIDGRAVSLAFCPTGPGGGVDNSCGKGGQAVLEQKSNEIKVLKSNIGGTTGAQLVERAGEKFVSKSYSGNSDQVHTEVATNKLYGLLGSNAGAPESELAVVGGKESVLSPFIEGAKPLASISGKEGAYEKLRENFAVDALLANWDVIGTGMDNVLVGGDGTVHRVDNGGALEYRAMGGLKGKAFGDEVKEIDVMRDPNVNPYAAKVFGKLTDEDVRAQVAILKGKFDRNEVAETLKQSGFKAAKAEALATKLEARVGYLSQRFQGGKASEAKPAASGQSKLQELESKAAAVKAKAAEERSKGSVSAATKRERAQLNKLLTEHKASLKLAAPKDVREAGDALDIPLGDVRENLDLPKGTRADDVEDAIQEALDHVTGRGMTDENGTEYVLSVLEKAGIEVPDESYISTLVSTHNDIAVASATRKRTMKDDDVWGYEYVTEGDDKVRDEHAENEGVILPKDHPFWDEWFPPNGWGCRCQVRTITWDEAEEEGYDEDYEEPEVDGEPQEGFDQDFQQDEDDEIEMGMVELYEEGPFGVQLAFCPTGPGGGVDNSCGKNSGGTVLEQAAMPAAQLQEIDSKISLAQAKIHIAKGKRDEAVAQIKAIKATGSTKGLSKWKTQRKEANETIKNQQDVISKLNHEKMYGTKPDSPKPDEKPTSSGIKPDKEGNLPFKVPGISAPIYAKTLGDVQKFYSKAKDWDPSFPVPAAHAVIKDGKMDYNPGLKTGSPATPKDPGGLSWINDDGTPKPGSGISEISPGDAKKEYHDWVNSLTPDEKKGIQSYTGSGYDDLNTGFREGIFSSSQLYKIHSIDSGLHRAGQVKEDIMVYRKVGSGAKDLGKLKAGDVYIERGYSSCSVSKAVWSGQYRLNIHVPKGARGAYVGEISHHKGEKEFLLPRDTMFKIHRVRDIGGQRVIDAEVVVKKGAHA